MRLNAEQKQILQNLSAVLEAGGSSLQDVVKVNIFLADMGDFAAVNEVYQKAFGEPKPVSFFSTLLLCGLWDEVDGC
jgi:2-iminobutanoate/2-iminopropanoate deaminase